MNLHDLILSRRSIRNFTEKPVEPEKINKMLEAAMYAPSARNYQPWHFVVIQKRLHLDRLSDIHPYAGMLETATAAILVCADKNLESNDSYNAQNAAAATQNILLSAHEDGIGSCWLGVYPREERMKNIADYIKLPEHVLPVTLIALGYPAEEKEQPERFLPDRIHYERW
ncbi:MAG: nitroreductase family protein [Bacteroidales bacterium]|nr:nitroreductase family protein [Bacteroidales bacterium]MCF8328623.1 nitroreductase family protein [Bacteroidales bacterium]